MPSPSTGAGPLSTAGPEGRVSEWTAAFIPFFARASAWPGLGPNPARFSRRVAWRRPKGPV